MLTTCLKSSPAAPSTLFRLARVCFVCSRMSGLTTSRVFGSSGPWPETNSRLPARIACASGEGVPLSVKPVVGAACDVTICLGMLLDGRLDLGRYRHRLQSARIVRPRPRPDADLVTLDRALARVEDRMADLEGLVVPLGDPAFDDDLVAELRGAQKLRLGL